MSVEIVLSRHWEDALARLSAEHQAVHAAMVARLANAGFDAPTAGRLALERLLSDLAEALEHQEHDR